MGARNLGRAAKFGWQKEKVASQAAKAAKSVKKAKTTSSKIKPGTGVKTSIKAGKGSRKVAKVAVATGGASAGGLAASKRKRKK